MMSCTRDGCDQRDYWLDFCAHCGATLCAAHVAAGCCDRVPADVDREVLGVAFRRLLGLGAGAAETAAEAVARDVSASRWSPTLRDLQALVGGCGMMDVIGRAYDFVIDARRFNEEMEASTRRWRVYVENLQTKVDKYAAIAAPADGTAEHAEAWDAVCEAIEDEP